MWHTGVLMGTGRVVEGASKAGNMGGGGGGAITATLSGTGDSSKLGAGTRKGPAGGLQEGVSIGASEARRRTTAGPGTNAMEGGGGGRFWKAEGGGGGIAIAGFAKEANDSFSAASSCSSWEIRS